MEEILFTPSSLIELLSKIEELKDLDVGIVETPDGDLQLRVGDSTYAISTDNAEVVEVPVEVVEEIDDINQSAYEDLAFDSGMDVTDDIEVIESGIIKELAKTLLVGGLVRMSAKALKK